MVLVIFVPKLKIMFKKQSVTGSSLRLSASIWGHKKPSLTDALLYTLTAVEFPVLR